jgi:hypothetical protein
VVDELNTLDVNEVLAEDLLAPVGVQFIELLLGSGLLSLLIEGLFLILLSFLFGWLSFLNLLAIFATFSLSLLSLLPGLFLSFLLHGCKLVDLQEQRIGSDVLVETVLG